MGKVTKAQAGSMVKMRKSGRTINEVARLFDVSRVTVCDYTIPGFYERRLRKLRERYTKAADRPHIDPELTRLQNIIRRPFTDVCELCDEVVGDMILYHRWDPWRMMLGIWACRPCVVIVKEADISDNVSGPITEKYFNLREQLTKEADARYEAAKTWLTS